MKCCAAACQWAFTACQRHASAMGRMITEPCHSRTSLDAPPPPRPRAPPAVGEEQSRRYAVHEALPGGVSAPSRSASGKSPRSGQVNYSAEVQDHESHRASWATSKVSTGLNLAILE